MRRLALGLGGAAAAAAAGWGAFEAGWLRTQVVELQLPDLPPELDGLRIAHLSDFHLGFPSRGRTATRRAVDWVVAREPDLVCVTGDLLSRPRGEREALRLLERLGHPYVVLGNHDLAESRDPFSRPAALTELPRGELLLDRSVEVELRGRRIELAGVDPRTWMAQRRSGFPEPTADLRILLCHFPLALDFIRTGRWHLILSGHLHAGQIVLPYGRGRLLLAHPRAPYSEGVYANKGTLMHVSAGTGTTFVPFRFFARPEATELVLRRALP
ncbi:MAG TPA: metallophosphoesterase [Gaiellaceae bacterium]